MSDDRRTGFEYISGDRHIIVGGGQALPGAPESWEWARAWAEIANTGGGPVQWSWDCHFKLDYDGDLLHVSSRFYPPSKYYGPKWDGTVSVLWGDIHLAETEFECESLDSLKNEVQAYVSGMVERMRKAVVEELQKGDMK